MDVEVLLHGAEKLCATLDVPGAQERVSAIRSKHQQITSSITFYQSKIKRQQSSSSQYDEVDNPAQFHDDEVGAGLNSEATHTVTDEDIEAEEAAIRELEGRKRTLESRVLGMEKDLGRLRE